MSRSHPIELELPRRETRYAFKRAMDRQAFSKELTRQIKRHGDRPGSDLLNTLCKPNEFHPRDLITKWTAGRCRPRNPSSLVLLNRLERRYDLPKNYFRSILLPATPTEVAVQSITPNQHHIVRWHLPKDFDSRSPAQRKRIMEWIERNVLSGATEYGARQKAATNGRYYLSLPNIHDIPAQEIHVGRYKFNVGEIERLPK